MKHGAVALMQADRPIGRKLNIAQVALLILDHGQLSNAIDERGIGREAVCEDVTDPLADPLLVGRQDAVDELSAADGLDCLQKAGREPGVVRWEELLGRRGHVVAMAWPANTVALGLVLDELASLEGSELLQDTGPTGAERSCQLVR